jgi:hypothetical protein
MKKMLPMRGYFVRAKIFGFMLIALMAFCLVYILVEFLQS